MLYRKAINELRIELCWSDTVQVVRLALNEFGEMDIEDLESKLKVKSVCTIKRARTLTVNWGFVVRG